MIYWGHLSHAILRVPDGLGGKDKHDPKDDQTKKEKADGYCEPTLESFCLDKGAKMWVAQYHKRWTWFSSWKPISLVILWIVLAVVLYVMCPIILN